MRLNRTIHLAILTLVTAVLLLSSVQNLSAFDDSRYEILQQQHLFNRTPSPKPPVVRPRVVRQYVPRKREMPPAIVTPTPETAIGADGLPLPPKPNRYVMIFGDSIGVQLGQGVKMAFAANPELTVNIKAKAETGLVNTSERDWVKSVREAMTGTEPVDMAIMMIGANDNQPLRDDTGQAQDPLTDKWREIYVKRIDDIVNAVRDRKIPLVWVGMPVMKSEKLTARMLAFNDIYRERVQRAGMTYIDIWEAFSDETSHYTPNGPDVAGQSVKIRAADGVHFTEAGSRKLAFFVEGEVRKLLEVPAAQEAPQVASAPVIVNVPPAGTVPTLAPAPPSQRAIEETIMRSIAPALDQLSLPLPETLSAPVFRVRPLAGPIVQLNAPVMTKGAELASGPPAIIDREAYSDALDVLDRGHAPRPKQGRADDFAWVGR